MRYIVFGAGAIGATIGGRLFESGHTVTLIARGKHYDALRSQGLRLADPDRTRTLPIPTVDRPDGVDWQDGDIVILAMKTQHTVDALGQLVASAPPSISVVCAQNGVENERLALRLFPNVYGMCVMLPATHLAPGAVEHYSMPVVGMLDLGRYPLGVDPTATTIAGHLTESGFISRPELTIMRWKYAKLLNNVGNALDAAAGPEGRASDLNARAKEEAIACFRAAGIDYASVEEDRAKRGDRMRFLPVEGRQHQGSSSWQSLARGTGSIESDYLNGEIVLLGRLHGVPTPVNRVLQDVANDMARTGAEPQSVSLDELNARLETTAEPS